MKQKITLTRNKDSDKSLNILVDGCKIGLLDTLSKKEDNLYFYSRIDDYWGTYHDLTDVCKKAKKVYKQYKDIYKTIKKYCKNPWIYFYIQKYGTENCDIKPFVAFLTENKAFAKEIEIITEKEDIIYIKSFCRDTLYLFDKDSECQKLINKELIIKRR